MDSIEIEGKTVDEAIEKAREILNVAKEDLNIEVVSNGSQGFLGFLGSRKACIKAGVRRSPGEEKKEKAKKFLEEVFSLAKLPATVKSEIINKKLFLTIKGDGSGILIGRRGQTLNALQYLVNKVVNRDRETRIPVIVDTENYRKRQEAKLVSMARQLGDRAKRQQTSVATELLTPQERRVIHLSFQNSPNLIAKSEGDGELKKVIISPRRQNQGQPIS
ncbi:MAG: Jag N-terminal domain-containing protein [Proteobacteria bacterium]|nr:Jag N-terminal domain-containing protein [Pseudomonadota bacterium]